MKLYYAPGTCAFAPHIILRELGKKPRLERVDLREKKFANGKDYKTVNPKGYVPALETKKGEIFTEVSVILQYLADKDKARKLLPKPGTKARYHAMESLQFVSSELHKTFSPMFNPAMPEEGKTALKQRLALRVGYLNDLLGKQKYINGKQFSVADAYAYTVLSWSPSVHFDLTPFPHVTRYLEEIGKRPSVIAAKKAEADEADRASKKADADASKKADKPVKKEEALPKPAVVSASA